MFCKIVAVKSFGQKRLAPIRLLWQENHCRDGTPTTLQSNVPSNKPLTLDHSLVRNDTIRNGMHRPSSWAPPSFPTISPGVRSRPPPKTLRLHELPRHAHDMQATSWVFVVTCYRIPGHPLPPTGLRLTPLIRMYRPPLMGVFLPLSLFVVFYLQRIPPSSPPSRTHLLDARWSTPTSRSRTTDPTRSN